MDDVYFYVVLVLAIVGIVGTCINGCIHVQRSSCRNGVVEVEMQPHDHKEDEKNVGGFINSVLAVMRK
jgi:hypothetical protein